MDHAEWPLAWRCNDWGQCRRVWLTEVIRVCAGAARALVEGKLTTGKAAITLPLNERCCSHEQRSSITSTVGPLGMTTQLTRPGTLPKSEQLGEDVRRSHQMLPG